MISILRSLKEHEREETDKLLQKSLECYLAAIQTFQKHAIPASVDTVHDYREKLGALHRELFADASLEALNNTRAGLEKVVETYAANVIAHHRESEQEIKQIITLLHQATATISERNDRYGSEFQGFATQLEQTAKCEDLRQIRVHLSVQVNKLRTCAEAFREENAAALKPIEEELKNFEYRLRNAERMASTDSLTGLFNRREGEKRANERIRARRIFCLLVLDLNHFKWINDRYGHHSGDQVLKIVARKLEEQIRPSDTVCRWGGDEFLIMMECDLKLAMNRARQIGEKLHGHYAITISGRGTEVEVSACLGVAAHTPGETLEQVFERADSMLYQIKHKCRGGNLAQAFSMIAAPCDAPTPQRHSS